MTNLLELQKAFANYLQNKPQKENFLNLIDPKISKPEERLNIYHNNVFGNLGDVLSAIFRVVKKIVGAEYFEQISNSYFAKYPSKSGNLDDYGCFFPKLIKQCNQNHKLLYLEDLAKIEWMIHKTYFGKDSKIINLERLKKLSEEQYFKVLFSLHPSLYLFKSNYPIALIYNGEYSKKQDLERILYEKKSQKNHVLIERCNQSVNCRELSKDEFIFLTKVQERKNIYKIYQEMSEQNSEFDIGYCVGKFISIGVLNDFKCVSV